MKALSLLRWLMEEEQQWGNTQFTTARYDEAIKELEALENKSCDGCKHASRPADREPCNSCKWLHNNDNWEAKQ